MAIFKINNNKIKVDLTKFNWKIPTDKEMELIPSLKCTLHDGIHYYRNEIGGTTSSFLSHDICPIIVDNKGLQQLKLILSNLHPNINETFVTLFMLIVDELNAYEIMYPIIDINDSKNVLGVYSELSKKEMNFFTKLIKEQIKKGGINYEY